MRENRGPPPTYGEKPVPFTFTLDDGSTDRFYLGSEVCIFIFIYINDID